MVSIWENGNFEPQFPFFQFVFAYALHHQPEFLYPNRRKVLKTGTVQIFGKLNRLELVEVRFSVRWRLAQLVHTKLRRLYFRIMCRIKSHVILPPQQNL